jgi:hypothetical protein
MSDPERLRRVAGELAVAIAAGDTGKRVRLPVVQPADAAGLINVMHAALDDAITRRDEQIGARMACAKGCSSCCTSTILVSEGEAVAVAEWLRQPEHAEVRARFDAAYPRWRDTLGVLVGQGSTRTSEDTQAWLANVQQSRAMCAFNHEGACSIYEVRPAICRKAHALDTNAHCIDPTTPAQYYNHPETEELYESQRPLRFALHKSLRPTGQLDLLCSTVKRVLGGSVPINRNDPCTCGSGKKYKKCCGT